MEKRYLLVAGIALIFVVAFGIYFTKSLENNADSTKLETNPSEIITVDQLVGYPTQFEGSPIRVTGVVTKVDEPKGIFLLGCEDACIKVPVRYTREMPQLGSEVIVRGEIRSEGGRYVFEGEEIEAR